jgi:hypothetical protein
VHFIEVQYALLRFFLCTSEHNHALQCALIVHFMCTLKAHLDFLCALLNKFGFCLVFKSAPGAHEHFLHLVHLT